MPGGFWFKKISAAGLFAACCLNAAPACAYFLDFGGGVRPTGLGEAFVAVADDANAMQYNSAGLSQLNQVEISGMYSDLYANLNMNLYNQGSDSLNYNLLALAVPLSETQGAVGLTWKQFNTVFYQENVVMLGNGRKLWGWGTTPATAVELDAGANLKWLQWQVGSNEFTQQYSSLYPALQKSGVTADVGLLLRLFSNWKVGASGENLIPADVGLNDTEYVPAVYRLGVAYQRPLDYPYLNSILATAEISNRNHVYSPKAGLETWHFHQVLGLRAGINPDYLSLGLSCRYAWVAAPLAVQMDYTYSYPWRLAETMGSHWLGLTLGWDRLKSREEEKQQDLMRKTQSALQAKGIARDAAHSADHWFALVQQDSQANDAAALEQMKEATAKLMELSEKAKSASLLAQNLAADAESGTITALALETAQTAANVTDLMYQAKGLVKNFLPRQALPAQLPPQADKTIPPLPEKYGDRIIIGFETKVFSDFGNPREIEPKLQNLSESLQKAVGIMVEWRILSPVELLLALRQGELDGVVAYETELEPYRGKGRLEPALTVRKNGRADQPCCLIVRSGSPIKTLSQAWGKRLGYSNAAIANNLDTLFFSDQRVSPSRYFSSMEKQKNARDSLWALQMEAVDVVAEYAYVQDIAKRIPEMKIRVITTSEPALNAPLWLRSPSHYWAKNAALQKLTAALLEIHRDPVAKPLLQWFQIERLVTVQDGE